MKLSLALIAKDEEKNLPRLLKSVEGVFDEVICVDTGSADRTKEVAAQFGAKVFDFKWIDDFSAARNFSFSKCSGDYICWLDCDDVLLPIDREKLLKLKPNLAADAYLSYYSYAQDETGKPVVGLYRHRLVKREVAQWKYPIHECMQFPPNTSQVTTDFIVTHLRTAEDAKRDVGRNIRLLEKAIKQTPNDVRLQFYFAKELFTEGRLQECIPAFEKYLDPRQRSQCFADDVTNAYWYMAMAFCSLGKEERAISACLSGIKQDARFAEFFNLIGQIHYSHERWEEAIRWFEIAARMPMPNAQGMVLRENYEWVPADRLCKCYSMAGRIEEAYEANEKALSYRPADQRLQHNREFIRDILFPGRRQEQPVRLSLGSGGKPTSGYRNTDLFTGPNIQEAFDQSAIPYPDSSVHAIYSEHALEHIGHTSAARTIAEWARVLRRGGDLVLKVPDLELCARNYLQASEEKHALARFSEKVWFKFTLYGIQDVNNDPHPEGQYHKTGFSKTDISKLLRDHGFHINRIENYDGWGTPSIEVRATQTKKPARVAWLIPGQIDRNNPSLRLRILNVHEWLANNGVDSRIVEDYRGKDVWPEIRYADAVVFIAFGPEERVLISKLRSAGVAVVYDHCEDLSGLPNQKECFEAASMIACCSTLLAEKSKHFGYCWPIPDAYEAPREVNHTFERGRKLRVVSCGMGGNQGEARAIKPIVEKLGMELVIISEHDDADIKWNPDAWLQDIANCDIVICAQRHWLQPAKSNNRATQAMALGMPVLASPTQAYKEAIRHGENGFICSTPQEWEDCLRACQDVATLHRLGMAALQSVQRYSIESVGAEWKAKLEDLAEDNCKPPAVDIVIPTWNNLALLQLCIQSIRANTAYPHQIIVVNSGTDGTKEWLDQQPDIISVHPAQRLHFSAANNTGICQGSNPYVCLLNDDTIVSKNWLSNLMQEARKSGVGAVNPFSNCDKGWLHDENFVVADRSLVPGMSLDSVRGIVPALYEAKHEKVVTQREWVAFFCTVIPRELFHSVGPLDEQFKSGCEDLDWCKRAAAKGYRFVTTFDSFVFHFGGSTRKRADALDREKNQREDRENQAKLAAKYGQPVVEFAGKVLVAESVEFHKSKPKFVIYTGQAWEKWGPKSLDEGGIGGSETCAVHVARQFAKKGYDCTVFGDLDQPVEDQGVLYVPHERFNSFIQDNEIDIFVSSRRADIFALPIRARHRWCWVHDIWLSPEKPIHTDIKIDKYLCLSQWHRDFFLTHHDVAPEKIAVTRDGVDLSRFNHNLMRQRGRMIYSSSPDRGLDVLLDMLPRIRKRVPNAELHVFYGFDNWEKAVRVRNNAAEIAWMERIKQQLRQPGVVYHGRVGQAQLAIEFLKSDLWAYPTHFTETFCITACEAMAAGLPVITTDLAALNTTVRGAGLLLPGDPRSEAYQDRFVEFVVAVLTDNAMWTRASEDSKRCAQKFSWDGIADEWLRLL
jgi:GT2 family glycosyltransferase/glycosyltransferase involved in cell wall biosynthesis/tetratricopeptide (TPR) repeat protein